MTRTGRRPGGEDTKGEILAAARALFAENGFHDTTIRRVAAEAGVDPALVHHYFGNKEDLFGAAIHLPLPPQQAAEVILAAGIEEAGERVARLFLSVWENAESRDVLLAMLRGAMATTRGAETLREFFESVMLEKIAPHVPYPDARLRVTLVVSHMVGLALLRYVIGFEALRNATTEEMVELLAPRLQGYLTG